MENADPIRSPDEVRLWHERGLRIVGLTWATGSRYAGGNASAPGEGPLTSTGRDMVTALDACNIIHDVSHLSDAAFDDLLSLARGPVIASHSNCRSLVEDRQRHLRDDQIIAIAQRGGMIGLNLYSPFLAAGRRATIADCIAHVQHVCDLVGHDHCIGLGSDIDGGFGPDRLPEGLDHPCMLHRLADALADAGWTDEQIYGFAGGNWRAFLRRSLPPS